MSIFLKSTTGCGLTGFRRCRKCEGCLRPYFPGSGTVIEVNEELADNPGLINKDAMNTWIIKVELSDPSELEGLLDEAGYRALIG